MLTGLEQWHVGGHDIFGLLGMLFWLEEVAPSFYLCLQVGIHHLDDLDQESALFGKVQSHWEYYLAA